jgi:hypothetical protein
MHLRGHVFVVDKFSWPVHRSRLFCGVKNPLDEDSRFSLFADLKALRLGDLVIFYHRRIDEPPEERGFRGIFKIISEPFFDRTDLEWKENNKKFTVLGKCPYCKASFSEKEGKCPKCKKLLPTINGIPSHHILPNRILIEPLEYYETPVDDNTAYIDVTDEGILRTMLFRKIWGPGRERSISHLLPEELEKLIRLLKKVNNEKTGKFEKEFYPKTEKEPIEIKLGDGPMVKYESVLEAWMMENIDKDYETLREVIGSSKEIEYFGNNVLYGIGGEKSDILVTHMDENGVRFKATVIELKKEKITESAIDQVEKYAYWVGQLVTANYILSHEMHTLTLQPVVIGHEMSQKGKAHVIKFLKEREIKISYPANKIITIKIEPIKILFYEVREGKINFELKNFPSSLSSFG